MNSISGFSTFGEIQEANTTAKTIIDNTNSVLNSVNIWVLVVILIVIVLLTAYFIYYAPEKKNIMQTIKERVAHMEERVNSNSNEDEIKIIGKSKVINNDNYYDKIKNLSYNDKITHLQMYAKEAQSIIPSFPKFPNTLNNKIDKVDNNPNKIISSFMKTLFPSTEFTTIDKPWLKGNTLECYSPELMLAVEYRDESNYIWPNSTKCSKEEFELMQVRNAEKDKICLNYNICLIKISYLIPKTEIPFAVYCKLLDAVPFLDIEIRTT